MKIAVPAKNRDLCSEIDIRFGRAEWLLVIDSETGKFEAYGNAVSLKSIQLSGTQVAQNLVDLGVEIVLTQNIGPNAFKMLKAADVKIFLAKKQTVQTTIDSFKSNELKEIGQANVRGHWI